MAFASEESQRPGCSGLLTRRARSEMMLMVEKEGGEQDGNDHTPASQYGTCCGWAVAGPGDRAMKAGVNFALRSLWKRSLDGLRWTL